MASSSTASSCCGSSSAWTSASASASCSTTAASGSSTAATSSTTGSSTTCFSSSTGGESVFLAFLSLFGLLQHLAGQAPEATPPVATLQLITSGYSPLEIDSATPEANSSKVISVCGILSYDPEASLVQHWMKQSRSCLHWIAPWPLHNILLMHSEKCLVPSSRFSGMD